MARGRTPLPSPNQETGSGKGLDDGAGHGPSDLPPCYSQSCGLSHPLTVSGDRLARMEVLCSIIHS